MHGSHPYEIDEVLSRHPGRHARHNRYENLWRRRAGRGTRGTSLRVPIRYGNFRLSRRSKLTQTGKGDGQCILSIYTNGETDSTSWYKIWQAAEATYAVCNKGQGRSGWYRSLGKSQRLAEKKTVRAIG